MSEKVVASVLVEDRRLELEEFPRPKISSDDALLRVEACGICGADVELYEGHHARRGVKYPVIPGHEPVGIIDEIGQEAAKRWNVKQGDRVIVEPIIPCGNCAACRRGETTRCSGTSGLVAYYSGISTTVAPALWGGYAQYMYLHPRSWVRKISPDVPAEMAALFNPLGNGILWASLIPQTRIGETAVVFGSGQRGLASVISLSASGARPIIVTDLSTARHKLDLALEFGADYTIEVDREDVTERVHEITNGALADVVIDTSAAATQPVLDSLKVIRKGGRIVLGGLKGGKQVPGFISDQIVNKAAIMLGAGGATGESFDAAIGIIESRRFPLEKFHSHDFPLTQAETAIQTLAGQTTNNNKPAIHIAIRPWD